jgi:hypothetical protein
MYDLRKGEGVSNLLIMELFLQGVRRSIRASEGGRVSWVRRENAVRRGGHRGSGRRDMEKRHGKEMLISIRKQ